MAKRLTQEEFLAKACKIHGNKYDYSKVEYKNASTNVSIICPIHGEFWQQASTHLRGCGCPKCKGVARKTTEEFIEDANKKHNGKYKYPNAVYINNNSMIEIECPLHGTFIQRAHIHLGGCGCPVCKGEEHKKESLLHGAINDCVMDCHSEAYQKWMSMFARCYNPIYLKITPSYEGVEVCEDWHKLSVFKEWFYDPINGYRNGYHLDKDILSNGNKVYSPDTCCFVPDEINCLFTGERRSKKSGLPVGVYNNKKSGYRATFGNKHIGVYLDIDSARRAYCEVRDEHIRKLAEKYFVIGGITKRVYKAMMNYKTKE